MKKLHPKVKAGGVAGALGTVILGIATRLHIEISAVEASALATLLIVAVGYRKASS